jgi:ABC-2 type transport system permease protein
MSGAVGAFRYLLARTSANRTRTQLRRVRSPRYAVAFLAGLAYLGLLFVQGSPSSSTPSMGLNPVWPMLYEVLVAVSIGWLWLFGVAEPALAFTGAEVQLLFPAPVSRGTLVRYKLVQAQIAIVLSVLIWLAVLSRRSPIAPLLKALSLWVLFTTLYLHRVGASFVRIGAEQQGRVGVRRHLLPLSIALVAILAVGWTVIRAFPSLVIALDNGTITAAMLALRRAPALRIVLWPFHVLVAPVFARTASAWLASIGWAVLLLVANYVWVLRAGVAFEEAAMQRADRLAALRAARRGGRALRLRPTRNWLPLSATGRPEVALAWKNAIAFQRMVPLLRLVFLMLTVAILIAILLPGMRLDWSVVRFVALSLVLLLVFFGPLYVRTDLQQDMLALPLLRSYPLTGRSIVVAEVGGTVAILLALEGVLLVIGFPQLVLTVRPANAIPAAVAGAIALPAITALRVAVANAWAVLLPGWVHLGPERPTGIEALGQNLLAILGSSIAHALLLALPVLVAYGAAWNWMPYLGTWAWAGAAFAGSSIAALELFAMTQWLGAALQRTEPSEVEASAH